MAALKVLFACWILLNGVLIAEVLVRFDYRAARRRMLRVMARYLGQDPRLPIKMPAKKADARTGDCTVLTLPRMARQQSFHRLTQRQ
jgi:hypothetical protein